MIPKTPCRRNRGRKSGYILHLVSHVHETEEHVERRTEGRKVLCLDNEDKRFSFQPAVCPGPGVYLLGKLREKRTVDPFRMGCRKPELGGMGKHGTVTS